MLFFSEFSENSVFKYPDHSQQKTQLLKAYKLNRDIVSLDYYYYYYKSMVSPVLLPSLLTRVLQRLTRAISKNAAIHEDQRVGGQTALAWHLNYPEASCQLQSE